MAIIVKQPIDADEHEKKRGRPRDPGVKLAILRAARALLDESGPGGVTMEAVALHASPAGS